MSCENNLKGKGREMETGRREPRTPEPSALLAHPPGPPDPLWGRLSSGRAWPPSWGGPTPLSQPTGRRRHVHLHPSWSLGTWVTRSRLLSCLPHPPFKPTVVFTQVSAAETFLGTPVTEISDLVEGSEPGSLPPSRVTCILKVLFSLVFCPCCLVAKSCLTLLLPHGL